MRIRGRARRASCDRTRPRPETWPWRTPARLPTPTRRSSTSGSDRLSNRVITRKTVPGWLTARAGAATIEDDVRWGTWRRRPTCIGDDRGCGHDAVAGVIRDGDGGVRTA